MDMEKLIEWVNRKLADNNLSIRKLAERMSMSDSNLSKILSGKVDPGVKFYLKLADAFNEPVSKVFKLAGILPSLSSDEEITFAELLEIAKKLTPEEREDVMRYALFQLWRRREALASDENETANSDGYTKEPEPA